MAIAMRKKRKSISGRVAAVIIAIVILLVATIGTTVAFLLVDTDSILNIFTPSNVSTEVVYTSYDEADNVGLTAQVKNIDDTEAYVRAAVVVNWTKTDADGKTHVYSAAPVEGTDYSMVWNNGDWLKKTYDNSEVLYYYKTPVSGNSQTNSLFSRFVQLPGATVPEGYELTVEVLGSGIQSTPATVVEEKWGVTLEGTTVIG